MRWQGMVIASRVSLARLSTMILVATRLARAVKTFGVALTTMIQIAVKPEKADRASGGPIIMALAHSKGAFLLEGS